MNSGRLYSLVTKYWPRIAAGLVVVIGLLEVLVGGLTADSGLEFYLMAWAGTTGGLWFLFEKGERALSEDARSKARRWLQTDAKAPVEAIPVHFSILFDRVFGERHFTFGCLWRSAVASLVSVFCVAAVQLAIDPTSSLLFGWPDRISLYRLRGTHSLREVRAVRIGSLGHELVPRSRHNVQRRS